MKKQLLKNDYLIHEIKLGYATEHEQYHPSKILEFTIIADKVGFDQIWTSDHFHPVTHKNAHGGFAWVWITSAAERTRKIEINSPAN